MLASITGNVLGWILIHLGMVTAIAGALSAVFGVVVAYTTMRIQWKKWQQIDKSK